MLSEIPIIMSSFLDEANPRKLFDQNFGVGLLAEDVIHPTSFMRMPFSHGYFRPWRHVRGRDSGVSNIASTSNEFKVSLDVQQFKPDQLSVKVIDNCVVIEGKHEEREDEHGYVSRQFRRRYALPESVDPNAIVSSLSSDGVLTVSAPKKPSPAAQNERVVPIVQTRQPVLQEKPKQEAEGKTMEKS